MYKKVGFDKTFEDAGKAPVTVSQSGVGFIGMRHDLANFKKRLKALERAFRACPSLTESL